jgi:hypothetical protein
VQLRQSIFKVLAYFDLFHYPLSSEEIMIFLDHPVSLQELDEALETMSLGGRVFRHHQFYSLHDDRELALKRMTGNRHAQALLPVAKRLSNFLFRFPFVRGIAISGSLSKNFAGPDADIDYFVITKANRLWLARTFMHFFKKLSFLVGRQHYYCMNYYIDESALEIKEKNIFTAIELITLLPVCGNGTLDLFFKTNAWAESYYPNYGVHVKRPPTSRRDGLLKRTAEFLLDNRLGNLMDNYFLRLTTRRWKQKEQEGRVNMKGGRMGLSTGKHHAKPNPVFFQEKILNMYTDKLNEAGAILVTEA